MRLEKIQVNNFRLMVDSTIKLDDSLTLIVGRNNTAKTSLIEFVKKTLDNKPLSFDDYSLVNRTVLYNNINNLFMEQITYDSFLNSVPYPSLTFYVDYSLENDTDNLGALSSFIIDIDENTTTAVIKAEYIITSTHSEIHRIFNPLFNDSGDFCKDDETLRDLLIKHFSKLFTLRITAVNPNDPNDTLLKTYNEIHNLFPHFFIPAERMLGEDDYKGNNTLSELISTFFESEFDYSDPAINKQIKKLQDEVHEANRNVQKNTDKLLGEIVNSTIGFGYPNSEELQLSVKTKVNLDEQIKNHSSLTYISDECSESLPNTHNGLGYKNLIKIEFLLASFARKLQGESLSCIPLLFIEEPEAHMHPQMQQIFAEYIEEFIEKISTVHIQVLLTSHSAHITNTISFQKIRYSQKKESGVIFKNLNEFAHENSKNLAFIKKYLTLTKCDLFFADKVILVEGASERIFLPDMIKKCKERGLFDEVTYTLAEQYYTLLEIGGAYGHIFIPFVEFLEIPCLILTDIDPIKSGKKSNTVSDGDSSSNETINWWYKKIFKTDEKPTLESVIKLTNDQKTIGKCHLQFQTSENGLCGRSLEESIKNVNREFYSIESKCTESDIQYTGKAKPDFALKLIVENPDYNIPQYIIQGLKWLNKLDTL